MLPVLATDSVSDGGGHSPKICVLDLSHLTHQSQLLPSPILTPMRMRPLVNGETLAQSAEPWWEGVRRDSPARPGRLKRLCPSTRV